MFVVWLLFSSYYICFTYLRCWEVVRVVEMTKAHKILIGNTKQRIRLQNLVLDVRIFRKKELKKKRFFN
jgi:hypothetical protein